MTASPGSAAGSSRGGGSASDLLARVHRGNELQDASRGEVLLIDPHAEGRERVLNCVHDRWRRDDHAALAHAAEVDVGVEGHGLEVRYLDAGNIAGGRHQ